MATKLVDVIYSVAASLDSFITGLCIYAIRWSALVGSAASAQLDLCFQLPPPERSVPVSVALRSPVSLNSLFDRRKFQRGWRDGILHTPPEFSAGEQSFA